MARITAIEPQQTNLQRVNVYLDGEFAFGLSRMVAAWLQVGQELGSEKIAALQTEDERESAYQKALHFISFRPRSAEEVRRNLTRRGLAETLVEVTLERLKANGLVDDRSFAQTWIENRSTFRPRSKSALKMELRRKGLNDELIASALEGQVDEDALAAEAARKYARRLAGLEWPEFRKKLGSFLARRGFSYEILTPLVSKVWQEIQMADDGDKLENKDEL